MNFREAEIPPFTNRGAISRFLPDSPAIHLDWCTVSFLTTKLDPEVVRDRLIRLVAKVFAGETGADGAVSASIQFKERGNPESDQVVRNGFSYVFTVFAGEEIASLSWGGNKSRCALEFRGAFCSAVDPSFWLRVLRLCRRYDARLTRADIAADYFKGYYECTFHSQRVRFPVNVHHFEAMCLRWPRIVLASKRGKKPHMHPHDEGNGRSWYVWKKTSGRELNVYEKGLQLDRDLKEELRQPELHKWVRCELRLYRQSRVFEIPLEVLDPSTWWDWIAGIGPYWERRTPSKGSRAVKREPWIKAQEFNLLVRKRIKYLQENFGKFLFFLGIVLEPEVAYKVLCNDVGEWAELKRFPGWRDDNTFNELVSASALELMPPSLIDGKLVQDSYNNRQNKRLAAVRDWIGSEGGECYAK